MSLQQRTSYPHFRSGTSAPKPSNQCVVYLARGYSDILSEVVYLDRAAFKRLLGPVNVVDSLSKASFFIGKGGGVSRPGSGCRNPRQPYPELPAGCRRIATNCRQHFNRARSRSRPSSVELIIKNIKPFWLKHGDNLFLCMDRAREIFGGGSVASPFSGGALPLGLWLRARCRGRVPSIEVNHTSNGYLSLSSMASAD